MTSRRALSWNSHFRWGYGPGFSPWRTSAADEWNVRYGTRPPSVGDFAEECRSSAREIGIAARGEPISLCISGGIDSEVAALSFLEAGIPFCAVTLEFSEALNEHDVVWAKDFCERHRIEQRLVSLDIEKFLRSDAAFELALSTQCKTPELLGTMWLMDRLEGFPVLGSGECYLVRQEVDGYVPGVSSYDLDVPWYLQEKETIAAWYKFFVLRRRSGAPGFFQFTPGQIHSFFDDPLIAKLVKNEIPGKLSSKSSKQAFYSRYWKLEEREKYTGYEKVGDAVSALRDKLSRALPHIGAVFRTDAREFYS